MNKSRLPGAVNRHEDKQVRRKIRSEKGLRACYRLDSHLVVCFFFNLSKYTLFCLSPIITHPIKPAIFEPAPQAR